MSQHFQQLLDQVAEHFTKTMTFTQNFGMEVQHFDESSIIIHCPFHQGLEGNMMHNILHGGATATMLDTASGMVAISSAFAKHPEDSMEEHKARVSKTATIDLRIDYLRPGRGDFFKIKAQVLRAGNVITAVQSQLYNQDDVLLASGNGTYKVG